MRSYNHGRFQQQASFLRRQFLQDGNLPFTNVLSEGIIEQALAAIDVRWLDRIYSPLVTLWVFLGQVLAPTIRAALQSLGWSRIGYRAVNGRVQLRLARIAKPESGCRRSSFRTSLATQEQPWRTGSIHSTSGKGAASTFMTDRPSRCRIHTRTNSRTRNQ